MNDAESPGSPSPALEDTLAAWDDHLAGLEKQAGQVLRAARRLRKVAREGAVAGFPAAIADLQDTAAKLQTAASQSTAAPDIDLPAAFASGSFLDELSRAAAASGVTLVQRDGRVSVYPLALRLEARTLAVRIGRKLERRIRPSFLARHLRALQQRPNRFNARSFLDRLFRAYVVLAAARAPDWQPTRPGEGPLVPFADLHELLTLMPVAAADYPLEEFLVDLLQLDRQPDARTGRGHRFLLGGSTGTKGPKRLSAFDEIGAQHDYYAIRFVAE
ncbi:MAG TPA: hypothetical protein VND19_22690 [Acetobacteraceae bacterium]|nr:hypothetical protein [Acetobacteraceae bacterium]